MAGDKPLSQYVRADAAKLRDSLVESGLAGSSVSRLFTTVKSIFNFACMETGLEIKNPFAGLYLDREQGVSVHKPIPVPAIKRVQAECAKDIVDQIGGGASISVGEAYGDGYPLEILSKWVTKACHQDLTKRSDYSVLRR